MPAPVRITVEEEPWQLDSLDGFGAARNFARACAAPAEVLADLGVMIGGGRGPV